MAPRLRDRPRPSRAIAKQTHASTEANDCSAWRRNTLDQIESWAHANNQEWDARYRNWTLKRLDKLVLFLRSFFDREPQDVIGYEDAAALIVMPKSSALKLARRIFRTGKGLAKDLGTEDLWFNMDWFLPAGEGYRALFDLPARRFCERRVDLAVKLGGRLLRHGRDRTSSGTASAGYRTNRVF